MPIKSFPTLSLPAESVGLVYFEFYLVLPGGTALSSCHTYPTFFRGKPSSGGTGIPSAMPHGSPKNVTSG